jgi:hypothetical protein
VQLTTGAFDSSQLSALSFVLRWMFVFFVGSEPRTEPGTSSVPAGRSSEIVIVPVASS